MEEVGKDHVKQYDIVSGIHASNCSGLWYNLSEVTSTLFLKRIEMFLSYLFVGEIFPPSYKQNLYIHSIYLLFIHRELALENIAVCGCNKKLSLKMLMYFCVFFKLLNIMVLFIG